MIYKIICSTLLNRYIRYIDIGLKHGIRELMVVEVETLFLDSILLLS